MPTTEINENQKRSIASSLALLDEVLCLFAEYANGREVHSVCYTERNRLTQRQREKLLTEIQRIREQMRQIKRELKLPVSVEDVAKKIWGHSAAFWEVVAEMESKRLKGYGEISASLAGYLDPQVTELMGCLQTMSGIAGGDGD